MQQNSLGQPVTGCTSRFPMVDRHGRRVRVGNKFRAQICDGPYGRTTIVEGVVTEPHSEYGQLYAGARTVAFHYADGMLRGQHCNEDVEHAHETWVEIVD